MLSIGELSKRTGVKIPTIRYYEQQADIHTLDLVSDWDWHQRWHPQSRPIHDLKVFHSGLASQLLYRAIQFRRQLSAPV